MALLSLAIGRAGAVQRSGPDTPEAEPRAVESLSGSLPWDDLTGLIADRTIRETGAL